MKNITTLILTFHTPENIILDCLNSIDKDIKVLIVENSETFDHKDKILSKFNNVEILCTGKNLGYGGGNNFGIKTVKTDEKLRNTCGNSSWGEVRRERREKKNENIELQEFVVRSCRFKLP